MFNPEIAEINDKYVSRKTKLYIFNFYSHGIVYKAFGGGSKSLVFGSPMCIFKFQICHGLNWNKATPVNYPKFMPFKTVVRFRPITVLSAVLYT